MKRAFVAALPLVVLLAACVPDGIVPQQTEIQPNTLGLGNEPAPKIETGWWAGLGDPGLNRLMADALAGNPSLGEALARLRAAKAGMEEANSQLYPHVNFDANEQYTRFSNRYIIPPPFGGTFRWFGTIQGDLSWEIDFWGKQAAALDKAKSLQEAARLDHDAARLAVSGAVVTAYVNLDRAYKLADIAAQTERDRASTVALTKRRVTDGLDSQVEEQEAEALLAQARQARVAADSERDIVVHALAALIGRGADAYKTIGRPSLTLDAALPLPNALPADLLSRRPDVLAAQANVDAALSGRKVAKAAFYPNVDLLATAGWAAIGLGPLFKPESAQYGGGPAIHLPLFDAGQLRADYAGAVADIDYAVADYNDTVTGAVKETADALTQIRSIQSQRIEHEHELAAAENAFRLAQTRYRTGLSNQITLLDVENTVFSAREGEVSLAADSAIQRITLLVSVGGDFQPPTSTTTTASR
ncbi:MAG TPA: efflux transporter outer membrane subunit [Rhizomicrobium sp.]|nr:efflux transporter outer membrane subunit [Rhizomicrobium sp.]